ncbi:hypothetical protein [Nostoc sp.]|uniref:hypothetical protein n=1 Tax=Nostoc sp. TaxID=1180 RepID=UPI002FFB4A96
MGHWALGIGHWALGSQCVGRAMPDLKQLALWGIGFAQSPVPNPQYIEIKVKREDIDLVWLIAVQSPQHDT